MVRIVDSIMGSGKSSWAIQHINDNTDKKYIYICPFLTEVGRIVRSCPVGHFYAPESRCSGGKLENLHSLLGYGRNISSTHALFRHSNDVTQALIKSGGYTLILDEALSVCDIVDGIEKDDVPGMILQGLISLDEDGVVTWNDDWVDEHGQEYRGVWLRIRELTQSGKLVCLKDGSILIWNFPIDVFHAFEEVFVMTYKFYSQEQRRYFDINGVDYSYNTVIKAGDKYHLFPVGGRESLDLYVDKGAIKDLLSIEMDERLNAIGDGDSALSSTWYKRRAGLAGKKALRDNLFNYFVNRHKARADDIIWTTFLESKSSLKGKGYTKGFLECNARATNNYANTHFMAYTINVFMHPSKAMYFKQMDVDIDQNGYALSELLQWVWRSAIRNGEKVHLYLPSSRMRRLLMNYLEQ